MIRRARSRRRTTLTKEVIQHESSARNIELKSVDDLFATEEIREDAQREKVQNIPLGELHPFKNHPFKVKDDAAMQDTDGQRARVWRACPRDCAS